MRACLCRGSGAALRGAADSAPTDNPSSAGVNVCDLDTRTGRIDHLPIPHVDTYMVDNALRAEEDEVAGLRRGFVDRCSHILVALCSRSGNTDSSFVECVVDKSGAVKAARTAATPNIRRTEIFVRFADNGITRCAATRGRCPRQLFRDLIEPLREPEIVAVLDFDLQIIRFVFFVVRIGDRQKIRLNGFCDVDAAEGNLGFCASREISAAHRCTCFHGGSVDALRSTTSGIVSMTPAGKEK